MGSANIIRLLGEGLKDALKFPLGSSDTLTIAPVANDTGAMHVGTSSYSMDLKWWAGSSYVLFDVGNTQLALSGIDVSSDSNIVTTANANAANIFVTTNTNTAGLNVTGNTALVNASITGIVIPTTATNGAMFYKVTALATNTTLNAVHMGGIITNRGAGGALNHTIPDAAAAYNGSWFKYVGLAGQNQQFTAATANTLVTFNDAAANAVIFNTANQLIGASAFFVCDGTSWYALSDSSATMTVIA